MGKHLDGKTLVVAFALGLVTGMRSQMPLALLGWRVRQLEESHTDVSAPDFVRASWFAPVTTTLAAGELVGDKLPMTPSRLEPAPLVGRLVFGGIAGALAAMISRQAPSLGASSGMAGALLGAFGGYHARRAFVHRSGLPDPIVALAEDAIAIGIGSWAVRNVPDSSLLP